MKTKFQLQILWLTSEKIQTDTISWFSFFNKQKDEITPEKKDKWIM